MKIMQVNMENFVRRSNLQHAVIKVEVFMLSEIMLFTSLLS